MADQDEHASILDAMDEVRERMQFPTDDISRYSDGKGPLIRDPGKVIIEPGMNTPLRDRFAMAALTGMLTRRRRSAVTRTKLDDARDAYDYADAMLEARKRQGNTEP